MYLQTTDRVVSRVSNDVFNILDSLYGRTHGCAVKPCFMSVLLPDQRCVLRKTIKEKKKKKKHSQFSLGRKTTTV